FVGAVTREHTQVLLRHAEGHIDRAELVDRDEGGGGVVGVGADEVALVDVQVGGAGRDGGAHGTVLQLPLPLGDAGLVGQDLGFERAGDVGELFEVLLGN